MRPTRIGTLVGLFAVVAAAVYWFVFNNPDSLPTLTVGAPIALVVLAFAEIYVARVTKQRLAGRPGTKPIHPISVARLAALAKASAVVGAPLAGGYAAVLAEALRLDSPLATTDTRSAILGVSFSVLLAIAGLLLENVCRVQSPPPSGES